MNLKKNGCSFYQVFSFRSVPFNDLVFSNTVLCHAHGNTYKIGENMYIPNKYSSVSEASCGMCKCGPDGPTGCRKLYCDLKLGGNMCERWTDGPPPGQCCPNCCKYIFLNFWSYQSCNVSLCSSCYVKYIPCHVLFVLFT